jgi:hypothetical protein
MYLRPFFPYTECVDMTCLLKDPTLHARLAHVYVDRLVSTLQDDQVFEFFRDSGTNLVSSPMIATYF